MRWLLIGGVASLFACTEKSTPISRPTPLASVDREGAPSGERVDVAFPSGSLMLTGYLWLPKGSGPHRAVVFNHGSERDPGDAHTLAHFYNDHGFVFFVPVRRGHGKSEGRYVGEIRDEAGLATEQKLVVDELVAQSDDVLAGLAYLSSRSEVRKDAIALTGCSFGGIEVVLTAERSSGFKVAVDFAGGAMSWSSTPVLRKRMVRAVARATIPILFVQAENDFSTEPSSVLAAEMDRVAKPNKRIIYPARGSTAMDGHALCRSAETWGPDVLGWIDAAMP